MSASWPRVPAPSPIPVSYTHLDKAIDLLDEACSDVNLQCKEISQLAELKKERDDYELELRMLNENTENQDYERLALIRSKLMQLAAKIEELESTPSPP